MRSSYLILAVIALAAMLQMWPQTVQAGGCQGVVKYTDNLPYPNSDGYLEVCANGSFFLYSFSTASYLCSGTSAKVNYPTAVSFPPLTKCTGSADVFKGRYIYGSGSLSCNGALQVYVFGSPTSSPYLLATFTRCVP